MAVIPKFGQDLIAESRVHAANLAKLTVDANDLEKKIDLVKDELVVTILTLVKK
jgi:hypothetical protein